MRRCRRRSGLLLGLLTACCFSIYVCFLSASLLPREEDSGAQAHLAREVVMNGQREILNINHRLPVMVASVSSSNPEQRVGVSRVSDEAGVPEKAVVSEQARAFELVKMSKEKAGILPDGCSGPWEGYPQCENKMAWMADFWQSDPCYAEFGVDGSKCSFQLYLSAVEHWCPPLPNSKQVPLLTRHKTKAFIQDKIEPLAVRLSANTKFDWIGRRIQRSWSSWTTALRTLHAAKPFNVTVKKILIHIGALTDKAGFKFAENADHGGPLGELVQWSDLIACLYLLGHRLEFSTEISQLKGFLDSSRGNGGCPTESEGDFDVIYIDIVGLKQFKKLVKGRWQQFMCLFRVLDSFGTEPQFNFKKWKPVGQSSSKRNEYGQIWGNWDLNPRQFLTMYPHTPDNSFLGFVVGSQKINHTAIVKKNLSLVYGKELYMWKDKRVYLDMISRYFDIHATIGNTTQKKQDYDMASVVPGFVHNHGILRASDLQALLKESKLFIGLGFPYEGPAPLEAIASGCFFLNPRIDPPINRVNSKFFKGKPTLRSLTSQNPYAEMFIGEPYVYTVDIENKEEVDSVLKKMALSTNPPPYLPYEFTYEGMLERVAVLLDNQDFCSSHQWPPVSVLQTIISNDEESCKDACYRKGLVCEPELFSVLNSEDSLKEHGLACGATAVEHSVHGPSYNAGLRRCSVQLDALLLSCVGSEAGTQRLCPCRGYRKGQVALCESCTR